MQVGKDKLKMTRREAKLYLTLTQATTLGQTPRLFKTSLKDTQIHRQSFSPEIF